MTRMDAVIEKIKQELDKILGRNDWVLLDKEYDVDYSEKLPVGKYELRIPDADAPKERRWDMATRAYVELPMPIASFELHPMINCCGVCVSSRAWVHPNFRGRGLNTILNQARIDIARANDYSVLLCTDNIANAPETKTLLKNGWYEIFRFVNRRTNHTLAIQVVLL